MTDRIIALVDMDCFYCQVETRLNPELKGIPMAVVQYNQWKQGGIIALSYEAKDKGVTRMMRGEQAKNVCPEIVLVTVPTIRDKADLTRYRDAGREVLEVLCKFSDVVQRASVDEAYIDLTSAVEKRMNEKPDIKPDDLKSTFVIGFSDEKSNDEEMRLKGTENWLDETFNAEIEDLSSRKLAYGALIIEEIRKAVLDTTGFKCSAGIAHNKVLAKLACGIHKPNRQTVLPHNSVLDFFSTLPLRKIRNLGGKFGEIIENKLNIKFMGDLLPYSEKQLKDYFDEKNGSWLYNMARGYDNEPVESRLVSKSIGCCKQFPGKTALSCKKEVEHWIHKLAEELLERLLEDEAMNKRRATQMVVSVSLEVNKKDIASSKTVHLPSYNYEKIVSLAMGYLKKVCTEDPVTFAWSPPIKHLGVSSGKFSDVGTKTINNFFKPDVKEKTVNLDETGSPSFFEKIFLKSDEKERPKLSILPLLSKEAQSDDSNSCFPESGVVELIDKEVDKENNKSEEEKPPKKLKTIQSFFNNKPSLKLEEIFPDLDSIDEETLSILPPKFQTKIAQMRNSKIEPSTSKIEEKKDDSPILDVEVDIFEEYDFKICDECLQKVPVAEYEEHTDFHLATKLQKELNQFPQPVVRKSPQKPNKTKRKSHDSKKSKAEKNAKKMKSIDQFFKK